MSSRQLEVNTSSCRELPLIYTDADVEGSVANCVMLEIGRDEGKIVAAGR